MENPLLTICVTTYNNEQTIAKTLESILNQSYSNFEILISDNGSTDKTLEIARSFNSQKIFIRKNINKIKSDKWYIGGYDNCNGCIESGMVRGEFVAFYHSDDIYQKDIAKKEVDFLIHNPIAGAVFTMGKIINRSGEIIGEHKIPKELKNGDTYTFEKIFKNILKYGNTFLITPTFMTRKNVFENVGLFNEKEFETSADLEMWLRILEKYPTGILQENLIRRRIGGASKSYTSLRTKEADIFKVMDYYLQNKKYALTSSTKQLRQYNYQKDFDTTLCTMNFLIKGQVAEARNNINHSLWLKNFRAFFENMNILRAKVLALKIILFIGINLGLGKYLGKILYRFA